MLWMVLSRVAYPLLRFRLLRIPLNAFTETHLVMSNESYKGLHLSQCVFAVALKGNG
jgi:hypothetical protein